MEKRIEKLRKKMKQEMLDGLVVTDKVNRRYLVEFTGSNGLLFITNQESILLVDGRYTEQAENQTSNVRIITTAPEKTAYEYLAEWIKKGQRIGFEKKSISYEESMEFIQMCTSVDCQSVETSNFVEQLRMVKEESEITNLRIAAELADRTFSYILTILKPGMTELDVANEIDYYSKRIGSEGPAFETIVASGKRTALPHAHASKKIINENELIMIDFGCIYKGYYSDMTRTFSLGKVSEKIKNVYAVLLEAQKLAIGSIALGNPLASLDQLVRDVLNKNDLADYFTHGLGHGVGLSCHEYPSVNQVSKETIEALLLFTIEPGVYFPEKFGIRIEDDVLIHEDGQVEVLTKTSKEWMEVAWM